MINKINSVLPAYVIPLLIFCFVFFYGCSSGRVQTVDADDLASDKEDIIEIHSIKLKNGNILTSNYYYLSIQTAGKKGAKVNYELNSNIDTSLGLPKSGAYDLSEVLSARVSYVRSDGVPVKEIIGGALLIGLLVFLFWANGERNKRQ